MDFTVMVFTCSILNLFIQALLCFNGGSVGDKLLEPILVKSLWIVIVSGCLRDRVGNVCLPQKQEPLAPKCNTVYNLEEKRIRRMCNSSSTRAWRNEDPAPSLWMDMDCFKVFANLKTRRSRLFNYSCSGMFWKAFVGVFSQTNKALTAPPWGCLFTQIQGKDGSLGSALYKDVMCTMPGGGAPTHSNLRETR